MDKQQQIRVGNLVPVFLYTLEFLIRKNIGTEEAEDRYGPIGCGIFFENSVFSMRFNGSFLGNQSPNFTYVDMSGRIVEIDWDRTYLYGSQVVINTELSETEIIDMFVECFISMREEKDDN